jgi:hypothetical protein
MYLNLLKKHISKTKSHLYFQNFYQIKQEKKLTLMNDLQKLGREITARSKNLVFVTFRNIFSIK